MFTVHGRNSDNTWFLRIEIVPPFKITDFNTPNTTEIFYFTSFPVTLSGTRQQRHEVIENLGSLFRVSRKRRPRKRRPQTADLENADLENTDLENADLENADLENADLENVRSFIKCMGERKFKTARAGDNHVNRYVDPKSRKWSG